MNCIMIFHLLVQWDHPGPPIGGSLSMEFEMRPQRVKWRANRVHLRKPDAGNRYNDHDKDFYHSETRNSFTRTMKNAASYIRRFFFFRELYLIFFETGRKSQSPPQMTWNENLNTEHLFILCRHAKFSHPPPSSHPRSESWLSFVHKQSLYSLVSPSHVYYSDYTCQCHMSGFSYSLHHYSKFILRDEPGKNVKSPGVKRPTSS